MFPPVEPDFDLSANANDLRQRIDMLNEMIHALENTPIVGGNVSSEDARRLLIAERNETEKRLLANEAYLRAQAKPLSNEN